MREDGDKAKSQKSTPSTIQKYIRYNQHLTGAQIELKHHK